ncbi:MAG: hypothetical protein MUF30_05795 [Burkholderiales bacterium]|nr:hypothetical protein [Burkholderiales bacterium]
MTLIITIVIFAVALSIAAVVITIPTMIGAKLVGAENSGFGSCLLATIVAAVISTIIGFVVHLFTPNALVLGAVGAVVAAFVYASILDTTWVRGFGIAMVTVAIALVLERVSEKYMPQPAPEGQTEEWWVPGGGRGVVGSRELRRVWSLDAG